MAKENQPTLPGFEEVFEETEKNKTTPQPRIENYRAPRLYEIKSHPLDLRFKGRLKEWLQRTEEKHGFFLDEVLSDYYLDLIDLYLFDDEWPRQEEVMAKMGESPNTELRPILQGALLKVWRRIKNGERAVEVLRFEPKDNFIYKSIINYRVETEDGFQHITTIDELANLPPEDIRKIAGAREMYERLKDMMQRFFPDWGPQIKFRQELSPEEAEKLK